MNKQKNKQTTNLIVIILIIYTGPITVSGHPLHEYDSTMSASTMKL